MLNQLFPSLGAEKFLKTKWASEVVVEHGPLERFSWLELIRQLQGPGEFLNFLDQAGEQAPMARRGEDNTTLTPAAEARVKFADGHSFQLSQVEKLIPELKTPLNELRS